MNKERSIKLIYVLIIVIILVLLVFNDNGVMQYLNLKNEVNNLEEKIKSTQLQIEKLNLEIDSLQNSDFKIEQVARNKYRMKFENEIPIKINKQ
jgi:cell division protein FtsB